MTAKKAPQHKHNDTTDEEVAQAVADTVTPKTTPKKNTVLFISAKKENFAPILANGNTYVPFWNNEGEHVVFEVAKEDAEAFSAHTFVQSGRLKKATGTGE